METKKATSNEVSESSPKTESPDKAATFSKWLRLLTTGLAVLFVFALSVQFLRGKLWVVGATGVWLLFFAMVITATLTVLLEQPRTAQKVLALPSKITPFGLGVFSFNSVWVLDKGMGQQKRLAICGGGRRKSLH
jgi:hypothetical protein